jgi:predicted aspartyl protease
MDITKTPKVNVTVTEKQCKFLLDTGSTVILLDQKTHDRIGAPKLTREKNPNLLPYGDGCV